MIRQRKQRSASSIEATLTLQQIGLMTFLFGMLAMTLNAAQPAWWTSRGAVNGSTPKDSVLVEEGQVKKMTFEAIQEMNAHLPGGAGAYLTNLATTWSNTYVAQGITTNDTKLMQISQIKWIAGKVYGPLITNGYMAGIPSWLHTNAAVDSQLGNLGQLKSVFAFEIAVPQVPIISTTVQGTTNAVITWSDSILSVQNYSVQYSVNGGTTWSSAGTVAGTNNSLSVTGLSVGTNYLFRVAASNPSGTSSPSTNDAAPIITLTTPSPAPLVP